MGNKWKLSTSSKPKPSNINKINQGSQIKFSYQDLIHSSPSFPKLLSMASYGGELLLDSSSPWSGISSFSLFLSIVLHSSFSFHCCSPIFLHKILWLFHWWWKWRAKHFINPSLNLSSGLVFLNFVNVHLSPQSYFQFSWLWLCLGLKTY